MLESKNVNYEHKKRYSFSYIVLKCVALWPSFLIFIFDTAIDTETLLLF